jgi:L-rhamnose mutarotase
MAETEVVGFRMELRPGMADTYERRHDEIWPELKAALLDAGVVDYRIFLDPGTNHLFAVMTRRRAHGLAALRESELMDRWWRMMADIMAVNPDQSPKEAVLIPMFSLA